MSQSSNNQQEKAGDNSQRKVTFAAPGSIDAVLSSTVRSAPFYTATITGSGQRTYSSFSGFNRLNDRPYGSLGSMASSSTSPALSSWSTSTGFSTTTTGGTSSQSTGTGSNTTGSTGSSGAKSTGSTS
ncbi:hypothetical protein SEPCBS57363_006157 [Sporothrix epigloea]|uniref:Uncharacterized protein n=1 Tax=Sporothrix epigloea TaxID=1892477 RepID=A0ABP0E3F5_9PEZI